MTIRELYKWAEENNATDYEIEIQESDDGYFLSSTRGVNNPSIEYAEYPISREIYKIVVL